MVIRLESVKATLPVSLASMRFDIQCVMYTSSSKKFPRYNHIGWPLVVILLDGIDHGAR